MNTPTTTRETSRQIEREGQRAILLSGDIKDRACCARAVQETMAAFGQIDILVDNAAFQLHAHAIDEIRKSAGTRPSTPMSSGSSTGPRRCCRNCRRGPPSSTPPR